MNSSSWQLIFVMLVIIGVLVVLHELVNMYKEFKEFKAWKKIRNATDENADTSELKAMPYSLKKYLMTKRELSFYRYVRPIANKHSLVVCIKPRIADFINLNKESSDPQYYGHLNRITSRHVDFLLCHELYVTPVLAIELDDSSHNRPDRIERDSFVNSLYETVGLPCLRTQGYFTEEQIEREITRKLEDINYNPNSYQKLHT